MIFFVPGLPATKGSTRSFVGKAGKVVTMSDNPRLKGWQATVAVAAQAAGVRRIEEAVVVSVIFFLPRPASHLTKGGGLKKGKPLQPVLKSSGDLDKLMRAVLDGLTGVAFNDDSQVVSIEARKHYCLGDAPCGANVEVRPTGYIL